MPGRLENECASPWRVEMGAARPIALTLGQGVWVYASSEVMRAVVCLAPYAGRFNNSAQGNNMKKTLAAARSLAAAAVLASLAQASQAVPITYYFVGTVQSFAGGANPVVPGVALGQTFAGSFTYESTAPFQGSVAQAPYAGSSAYDTAATITASVAGLTYNSVGKPSGAVWVGDNLGIGDTLVVDMFQGVGSPNNTGPTLTGSGVTLNPYFLRLDLVDSTGTVFNSQALPSAAFSLASFSTTKFYFNWLRTNDASQIYALGSLTYLSQTAQPVPEPGTAWMAAFGVAGLAVAVRRRAARR